MRIVLLGPPASGKGTQADQLTGRLAIPKISTGDMLRAAKSSGSELGREVAAIMERGGLVSDDIVIRLVDERLNQADAAQGFVLDGFPRTVAQAQSLDELLRGRKAKLDSVLSIEVDRSLLVERATLRRMDKRTGQIYHLKYNPPPPGAELVHRADDQEETVGRRLDEYDRMTAALGPYYERLGLLRRVDGVGSPAEVTERVLKALG